MLQVTTRSIRWMARTGRLAGERTRSGLWLFQRQDVRKIVDRRAEARLRRVYALVPRLLPIAGEPRQLSLFAAGVKPEMVKVTPLRLVARNGDLYPIAEVHRA